MKKLFSVIFLFFSLGASAQNPQFLGAANTNLIVQALMTFDSAKSTLNLHLLDTAATKMLWPTKMSYRLARESNGRVYQAIPPSNAFVLFDNVTGGSGGGGDSTLFLTIYRNDTAKTNIRAQIVIGDALNVKYTDTAAMFSGYVRIGRFNDSLAAHRTAINLKQNLVTLTTTGTSGAATFNQTTGALNIPSYSTSLDTGRANGQVATAFAQNKIKDSLGTIIGTSVKYADTAGMLGNYQRSATAVKYADTAAMLANYLRKADTTGKFVTSVVKRNDSFFYVRNGTYTYFGRDSTGGGSSGVTYLWSAKITDHFEAAKITGVTDGSAVGTWTNTGQGTKTNLVADGTSPNYIADYRGMPAVRFVRASSTSMTFTNQAFKQCVVVCNNVDGNSFADYEGLMGNSLSGADWLWYADAAGAATGMTQAGGDKLLTQAFETSTNTFAPLSQTKITSFTSAAGISSRTTRVGAFWNLAGRYWNGYIQEIIFFSDLLTKEEYIALHQYLTAKYAVFKPIQFFVDGNSIPSGGYTGVTSAQGVGNRMILKADTVTSSHVYSYNAAVGGTVTAQNAFNAATVTGIDYRQGYQPLFGRQVLICYSATNQMAGAGTGLTYISDIQSYAAGRVAVNPNLEVFVPTIMTCDSSYQLNSERVIANTALRAMKPTKNFKVINVTVPEYDSPGAFTDTSRYGDGIHPTQWWADKVADIWIMGIFKYYAQE